MDTARKHKPRTPAPAITEDWLSARQAAAILGCTRSTVASYALRKMLRTRTMAGRVFYEAQSVIELASELQQKESTKS